MGFSVSGSAAIVFAGLFLSFGILYGATSNSFERVSEAQRGQTDASLETQNTDIAIASVERSGDRLTVLVDNTGATGIPLNETDFLVNNSYRTGWRGDAQVDSDGETWLWLPDEQLNITIRTDETVQRVKVVTDTGVADTKEVP